MSDAVFHDYDLTAFEWQYDARRQVPDHELYMSELEQRSFAARQRLRQALDVRFGEQPKAVMDLFPAAREHAPVHLFVHGGYWHSRDKAQFSFMAEPLVAAGALVAVTNYDLCPDVTIAEIVGQMRAACGWLWRHAAEHGGDPERIHVSGHSAGAHLAAMLVTTDWPSFDPELPPDLVKSATVVSGLYDLEPIALHSFNEILGLDSDLAARMSPVNLAPPADFPVTIIAGTHESDEFRWQSSSLAERWRESGAVVEYFEFGGHNHFSLLASLADADAPIVARMLAHMGLDSATG